MPFLQSVRPVTAPHTEMALPIRPGPTDATDAWERTKQLIYPYDYT